MKANAPEEIYLLSDDRNPNGLSICWYEAPYCTGAIEYVRKDAFIEKACEFIEYNITGYIDVTHKGGDEDVILQHEFIKEFRKYMEGE